MVQILTRLFSRPGKCRENVAINRSSKISRKVSPSKCFRQNHTSKIDATHPLLPISLDCLRDNPDERPSAPHLFNRLETVSNYSESVQSVQEMNGTEYKRTMGNEASGSQYHCDPQVQGLQQIISSQASHLRENR